MAQSTHESLLEELLKSRYPLTYYLSRQQHFVKVYSTTQTVAVPTPPPESATIMTRKRKAPLPPPCFDVPDTLDPFASEYNDERNEVHSDYDDNTARDEQNDETDDDITKKYDETLLKSINNRMNDSNSDYTNEKFSSIIKRSSAIQLEFSPMQYENYSPLQKAIQNGLNIINK